MRKRIVAVVALAGSMLLAPVVMGQANAGHGAGGGGHFGGMGGGHLPALHTSVAWAAPTLAAAVGMEAMSLVETGVVAAGVVVVTLRGMVVVTSPGMVAMLGMETTGMGIGITTTTTTSPITIASTITSTIGSL